MSFHRLVPECSRVTGAGRSPRRNAESKVGGAGTSDFGIEAINQLVSMLAEVKGLIVVIVAGYAREMACVIKSNEGLERRFVNQIDLNPFDAEDFTNIFAVKVISALKDQALQAHLTIREDARRYIKAVFEKLIKLNAMQNQAGDVDLISNYFATALGESELDGLSWNNYDTDDDLIILSRAFNRFAERKGLKERFKTPPGVRAGGASSPFLVRTGGNARFAPRIHPLLH